VSGAVALTAAVVALEPDLTIYDGQVTSVAGTVPPLPWVLRNVQLPEVAVRAMSRRALLRTVRVRYLVYAGTAAGVRILADILDDALEASTPAAEGWVCSPLERVNSREAVQDPTVTIADTNKHPMFGVLEYVFTASARIPVG
jgi:hypothetical protein